LEQDWADLNQKGALESRLEEIIRNYKEESYFHSYYESWQHRRMVLSSWISPVWGAGAYPIKPLIAYFLLEKFFTACGVTGDALWGTGVALAVPASYGLFLGTLKRLSSLQKESSRLLDSFYKMDTPGGWGAALLARWCGLTIIGFPTAFYVKREALDYWKDNPALQYAFLALFVGEATAAANLFFETHFTGIVSWFEKGAPVFNRCTGKKIKLLPCWPNQETYIRIMEKLKSTKWVLNASKHDLQFCGNERLNWRGSEATRLMAVADNL
jgi:hypothetical protein